MQITIHVNAPELAQAILSLSAALSAANSSSQDSIAPPVQPVTSAQPINTATPQQAAQAYGAPTSQAPVGQPAPITGQTTAQAPTAPAQQAPDNQAPVQQAPAQHAPTTAPTYDFNQLAAATMQLQEAGQNIFELFAQFGIQALNQLPKERYGEYANVLRERGAKL